ncbi:hypothetical protein FQN60_009965 [Etheostoma spectabile]|uniref:Uncharacterized protein n=1 Tax=Etheostoma spectabile TaxID=54343 RepID=A0A5J5D6M5_9PERO|nr:hypothetical protein FQN60_009965 [Etheostoma spectabile]
MQKNVHHMEQDPYGSRFVMGQSLVNSRRHITEIQLSRGWESPRLRLLLEFAGRQKHPQQHEDPGLPHRAKIKPRLVFKLGPTEMSAHVASTPASVRTELCCVTGAGALCLPDPWPLFHPEGRHRIPEVQPRCEIGGAAISSVEPSWVQLWFGQVQIDLLQIGTTETLTLSQTTTRLSSEQWRRDSSQNHMKELFLLLLAKRAGLKGRLLSVFPEWLIATSAAAAGQSMRLPQIVKRSISSRSFLGVLCCSSEASCASHSSSLESEGAGCLGSGGGVGERLASAAGDGSVGRGGNKSLLGVGWVVTEEEEHGGGLQVAPQSSDELTVHYLSSIKQGLESVQDVLAKGGEEAVGHLTKK